MTVMKSTKKRSRISVKMRQILLATGIVVGCLALQALADGISTPFVFD